MKILLIGISVRAMAESAARGGYGIVALDAFGDRDLRATAESHSLRRDFGFSYSAEGLYRASLDLDFDVVAYTSNLENHPETLSRFAEKKGIVGNHPQAVARVRHWPGLFEKLRRAGHRVPETIFPEQPFPASSERGWIVKPVLSGGGHGIRYCEVPSSEEEKTGCRSANFMIQEYIAGIPCSASFVANGRESVVIGIAEQLIGMRSFGANGFRFCGNIVPAASIAGTESKVLGEIRALTNFLSREFDLRGVNGIDFILRDGQVYLTEVNPRYTASMEIIEMAYGLPVFDLHLRSVLNSELPEFDLESRATCRNFHARSYLYAERDVILPDTDDWAGKGIRDIPESREGIVAGSPVCTLFGEGKTREDALSELICRAERLKEEIYG